MLVQNQVLLAKVESSYGVDASPVKATDAILCGPVEARQDIASIVANAVRASISAPKTRLGRKMIDFTITCDLKGSGTAGTAPQLDALLQACAHTKAVSAGVSVTYTPESDSTAWKSCTIYFYEDGRVQKAVGCMGNFTLSTPPGGIATITFNMRGKLTADEDAALPSAPTFESTEAVVVESGGVSFGAFTNAVIRSLTYASNNQMAERLDVNSADGVKGMWVSGRNPQLQAQVEATTEATKAWFGNFTGRVEEAVDLVVGTTAGNIATFTWPKWCAEGGLPRSNDNGILMFDLSGQCLENAGDDNVTIVFT